MFLKWILLIMDNSYSHSNNNNNSICNSNNKSHKFNNSNNFLNLNKYHSLIIIIIMKEKDIKLLHQ